MTSNSVKSLYRELNNGRINYETLKNVPSISDLKFKLLLADFGSICIYNTEARSKFMRFLSVDFTNSSSIVFTADVVSRGLYTYKIGFVGSKSNFMFRRGPICKGNTSFSDMPTESPIIYVVKSGTYVYDFYVSHYTGYNYIQFYINMLGIDGYLSHENIIICTSLPEGAVAPTEVSNFY